MQVRFRPSNSFSTKCEELREGHSSGRLIISLVTGGDTGAVVVAGIDLGTDDFSSTIGPLKAKRLHTGLSALPPIVDKERQVGLATS